MNFKCSEFIENLPLNMKNVTTYFWYNSKHFQNPEDRIGEFKWSESLSQCITSILWLFWAHFSYFVSPKSPYYFTALSLFISHLHLMPVVQDAGGKQPPKNFLAIQFGSSSTAAALASCYTEMSAVFTVIWEWLENKSTTTTTNKNLWLLGS